MRTSTWHDRALGVAAVVLAIATHGCGTGFSEGRAAFERGRYPRAKAVFHSLEADYPTWDDEEKARFALYAGLTYAELGDLVPAKRWLDEAQRIEEAHRGALSADDWHRLLLGREAIEAPLPPAASP